MRETGGGPVVIRRSAAVEPATDAGIDVDRDFRPAGKSRLEPGDDIRRGLRIISGKVHDERATNARGEIERRLDLGAVIDDRAVDPAFGCSEPGEPAADA